MKKVYLLAAAAAMLTACSNTEELSSLQVAQQAEAPVNFNVYTPRTVTKAGAVYNVLTGTTDALLKAGTDGFGVIAYYTDGEQYDAQTSKPTFMYNQQVLWDGSKWGYDPIKYWPNEYGNTAEAEEFDYVSFFSYAPYVKVNPATGVVDPCAADETGIVALTKNTAQGDPFVKYIVDTDPTKSVDLLWGVAAGGDYTPIVGANPVVAGMPFIDLLKPQKPATDKINFNLRHALAKLNVQIDYDLDEETVGTTHAAMTSDKGNTRIYLREITIGGFTMKGALNLHNETANIPLWKGFDMTSDLSFDVPVTFFDGLKDGKEGTENAEQKNEKPQGLNPVLLEPYAATWAAKTGGISNTTVNLFAGATSKDDVIFVIPRNDGTAVDVKIVYDVETADENLADKLSDGLTNGSHIENVITKSDIFSGGDIEPGKGYVIKIHVGMTSVKIDATVIAWDDLPANNVDITLPANQ